MHSKTPAAFKKNIKTEISHGKPQKQAVAIAYSEQRRAQHKKHAHGGEIENCQMCAKGGDIKGVHEESYEHTPHGESHAGKLARRSQETSNPHKSDDYMAKSRAEHKKVLTELKELPSPKLKGLAHGGEVHSYQQGGGVDDGKESIFEKAGAWIDKKAGNDQPSPKPSQPTDPNRPKSGAEQLGEGWKKAGFAEGGEVESEDSEPDYDSEVSEVLGKELMEAFESKDHKRIMESIEACVLQCLDKDEQHD